MSFKLSLEIGYFDPATRFVPRPLDAAFVQQVIVQAGGLLVEEVWSAARLERNRVSATGQKILGFLKTDWVILAPSYVVWLAIGGPNPPALAFLRMMVAEGCMIMTEDGESTQVVLDSLAATEARHAARNNKV